MNNGYNVQQNYSQTDLTQASFIGRSEEESYLTTFKKSFYIHILAFIVFVSLMGYIYLGVITPELSKNTLNENIFLYILLLYLCIIISVWTFLSIIMMYLENYILRKDAYFGFILLKQQTLIKIIVVCGIVLQFIQNMEGNILNEVFSKLESLTNNSHVASWKSIVTLLNNFWIISAIFAGTMTIRLVFLEYIRYAINKKKDRKRLAQNNKDMDKIFLVNSVTGKSVIYKSEKWIRTVFRMLSPEGNPLTLETLKYFFSPEDSKSIMELFDLNLNNQISESQFRAVWLNVITTKEDMDMLIYNKADVKSKLSKLTLFFVIIFTVISSFIFFYTENYFSFIFTCLGFLLPMHYIFGNVPGDLFKSLVFVFITRPFDVGDLIKFDGKKYQVREIGLMYSTFKYKSLNITIPNVKISGSNIINFRLSNYIEKTYTFKYNIELFKKKRQRIREEIRNIIIKKPYTFGKHVKIQIIKLIDEKILNFVIVIYVNPNSINYKEEIDEFTLELTNIINESNQNTNLNINPQEIVKEI
ncbi:mechanosensitive channel of small conductance (MscS1D) [Vairimorpha necatrix]|uniref:Mechanosensitive channel of small conductance (MscS1D) n=1 Tax=Vairimorpha necatrix TaxID=6039 RepID=A0AAX4JFL9_9MICR